MTVGIDDIPETKNLMMIFGCRIVYNAEPDRLQTILVFQWAG